MGRVLSNSPLAVLGLKKFIFQPVDFGNLITHPGKCGFGGGLIEDCFVPVFPDRIESAVSQKLSDFLGAAFVRNTELFGGLTAGASGFGIEFDTATPEREMEIITSLTRVSAGFGVAASTHAGDAEREEGIAQSWRFAGTHYDPNARKGAAESADELDEFPVGDGVGRFESTGGGPQTREADRKIGFPAVARKIFEMGGGAEHFAAPVCQAQEDSNADAAESSLVSPFRAFEAPVEVALGPCGMKGGVSLALVSLLINDEALGTGFDHKAIFWSFHRTNLNGDGRDEGLDRVDALFEISTGGELRVFSRDDENVPEALRGKMPCFGDDLFDVEGDAQNGVVAREAAVSAIVDAFVREVKRRKEAHRFPEVFAGEFARFPGE